MQLSQLQADLESFGWVALGFVQVVVVGFEAVARIVIGWCGIHNQLWAGIAAGGIGGLGILLQWLSEAARATSAAIRSAALR